MSNQTIRLNNREIRTINQILSKDLFEDVSNIILTSSNQTGIGGMLELSFDYTIDDVKGTFSTIITGPEHW